MAQQELVARVSEAVRHPDLIADWVIHTACTKPVVVLSALVAIEALRRMVAA